MTTPDAPPHPPLAGSRDASFADFTTAQRSKFRFKARPHEPNDPSFSSSSSSSAHQQPPLSSTSTRHKHKHHHHHRRRKHREQQQQQQPSPSPPMSPTTAFRESLFDAMADDEGADYWANVYGQPIHTYPRTRPSASGGGGALESMSDAEYTSYVRARMWERTHQHIAAERARRDEARRTAQQQQREHQRRRARAETAAFERRLDESLRRGAERKREKGWAERWETYGAQWDRIREARDIPWPVESGRARDLWREEIERFFVNGHRAGKVGLVGAEAKTALWKVLRAERVRWHPDKIQQRFGAHGVDAETMKAVTAVFQVVDRMFREAKGTE